jgi:ketosteroid isomerase-like protein
MISRCLLALSLLCTATTLAQKTKPDLAAAKATLRKLDAQWAQTKDVNTWLSYYTDDAIVFPPNEKMAKGKAAARKSVADLLTLPNLQLIWKPIRIEVAASGDFAYIASAYTMSFTDDANKRVPDAGKTLEIWKLQPNGEWKCVADTWNSDLPATP